MLLAYNIAMHAGLGVEASYEGGQVWLEYSKMPRTQLQSLAGIGKDGVGSAVTCGSLDQVTRTRFIGCITTRAARCYLDRFVIITFEVF